MHSDIFFVKDFYRGFDNFLKQDIAPVYKYEFKFDGEFNAIKNLVFATRPVLRHAIKGYYNSITFVKKSIYCSTNRYIYLDALLFYFKQIQFFEYLSLPISKC